ncbi:MAG: helix-turn-helix domain-containing protein [Brotaphodocola sp.]
MSKGNFEIYYYNEVKAEPVSWHQHDHYEFYFFLEGDVDYQIEDQIYPLEYGDYLLIPPHVKHHPIFHSTETPYRRFVLWISEEYYHFLCQLSNEYSYTFDIVRQQKSYHSRPDYIQIQELQARLTEMIEENRSSRPFSELNMRLMFSQFLIYVNRLTYDRLHEFTAPNSNMLYLNVCAYINDHLNEDLSLDRLADYFFASKYHISHIFKDNMGISLHQYILKKRLHACKNAILSGLPLNTLFQQYGFSDYSSFYRAFRKEYGVSPTDFREQHRLPE